MTCTALVVSQVIFAQWDPSAVNALMIQQGADLPQTSCSHRAEWVTGRRWGCKLELCKALSVQNYNFVLDNSGQPASGPRYWISVKLRNVWVSWVLMWVFALCQMALIRKIFWFRKKQCKRFCKGAIYYWNCTEYLWVYALKVTQKLKLHN